MTYVLKILVLGSTPEVPISESDYQALGTATKVLNDAFYLEEKYEILISNYEEFERAILESINSSMIRQIRGYEEFFEEKLALNIKLINLLTSTRLYIDSASSHAEKCVGADSEISSKIKQIFSTEYDSNYNYQFMEQLRNHVQHCGLAIHKLSMRSKWSGSDQNRKLEYSIDLSCDKEKLTKDKSFKKRVLENFSEEISLKTTTRSYIESISKIHQELRELIKTSVLLARKEVENAHHKYSCHYSEKLTGLAAYKKDKSKYLDKIPLLLDWDDVREKLLLRNHPLINQSKKHSISS